jgi:hypothetical protein
MLARLHHYEELEQLKGFFQDWYGFAWEQRLQEEVGITHGDITGALRRCRPFKQTLLPKLRVLRKRILDNAQVAELAKPSITFVARIDAARAACSQ